MAGEEFTFTLLDSPEINAFATADNYVYVNRGLLNYIANEAQLVSVLAHEVGHITQKHVSLMPAAAGGASFLAWLAGGWTFTDLVTFLVLICLVIFRWSDKPVFLRQGAEVRLRILRGGEEREVVLTLRRLI